MHVFLTGATGTAGSAALGVALDDPDVSVVTALVRGPLDLTHRKLRVLRHDDFLRYDRAIFDGVDACLWCLGISTSQVTAAEYERITLDYTLAAARTLHAARPDAAFCFLSGSGADSTEKSRILFARVKGRAENLLGTVGFRRLHHFRPGYIHPTEPRPNPKIAERVGAVLAPVFFRLYPNGLVAAPDLGRAMLRVAKEGHPKTILEQADIHAVNAR